VVVHEVNILPVSWQKAVLWVLLACLQLVWVVLQPLIKGVLTFISCCNAVQFLQEVRSESQGKWSIKEPHVQALLDCLYCEVTTLTPYAGGAAFIHAQRWVWVGGVVA
jgi:hypothetical protein